MSFFVTTGYWPIITPAFINNSNNIAVCRIHTILSSHFFVVLIIGPPLANSETGTAFVIRPSDAGSARRQEANAHFHI